LGAVHVAMLQVDNKKVGLIRKQHRLLGKSKGTKINGENNRGRSNK